MPVEAGMIGFMALSFAMGMRHGFDADHIAVIDGLTRYNARDRPVLAQTCGLLFTAGHILVVLGLVLLITFALQSWRPPEWLQLSGAAISVAFLLIIGSINVYAATRAQTGEAIGPVGLKSRLVGRISDRRGVVGIGMLFALSFDTLSQAGLMAIAGAQYGLVAPLLAGLSFGIGMFVTAGLTSLWVARMSSRVDARAAAASRITTLAIGLMSLGVAAIVGSAMFVGSVSNWLDANGLLLSMAITGGLAALFIVSLWLFRTPAEADRVG